MKCRNALAVIITVLAMSLKPALAAGVAGHETESGMQFALDDGMLDVQWWSDDIVRIIYFPGKQVPEIKSLAVVASPTISRRSHSENEQVYTLAGSRMTLSIDKQSAAVTFLDSAGKVLLKESPNGRKITPAAERGIQGNVVSQAFDLAPDEGIYGLGQHQQGWWNYRSADGSGVNVRLAQANMEVGVPVIASSKGYMLLWDNPAVTTISVGTETGSDNEQKVVRWSSEFGKAIDYYFCYSNGTLEGAMKAYRHLTGDAPLMPKWMLGFWQCKERYASQDELLGVAKKLRELKVPVDGIIQDWQYWPPGNNTWGSHRFDLARYPDPVAMFKELHAQHYHTLISVWAKFDLGSDKNRELNDAGGMYSQVTRYAFRPVKGSGTIPSPPRGVKSTGSRFAISSLPKASMAGGSMRLNRKLMVWLSAATRPVQVLATRSTTPIR